MGVYIRERTVTRSLHIVIHNWRVWVNWEGRRWNPLRLLDLFIGMKIVCLLYCSLREMGWKPKCHSGTRKNAGHVIFFAFVSAFCFCFLLSLYSGIQHLSSEGTKYASFSCITWSAFKWWYDDIYRIAVFHCLRTCLNSAFCFNPNSRMNIAFTRYSYTCGFLKNITTYVL